ncbi:MAG: glycosyltransferase family 2 protein [Anaerolineales bacterium]|nr:glycosyltransferase family 2 protein [Anaerolineales bacterium]
MARVGINPARGKLSDYCPARVTVTMITYIPDLSGYFEQRLEVLKLVFASLHAHTSLAHDLLVFDNGSCSQVVEYLQGLKEAGQIDYLLLSRQNIGKIGALRILFSAAPGEIIAYSDDDIFFYPGWLEAQLELLDAFPQAGMVSGLAVRNAANHAHQSLDRLAAAAEAGEFPGLTAQRVRRIPDEWEADWAVSTGREPQAHLQDTREQLDIVFRLESKNNQPPVEAIGSANHFQFIGYKAILLQALPSEWSGKLMGHMVELDEAVDQLGCLRLSTAQRYTRHLGNALSQQVLDEAQALGLQIQDLQAAPAGTQPPFLSAKRKKHWLLRIPGSRRVLSHLYKRLFDILFR